MESINQRIAAVLKVSGLTKTAFAKRLRIGQPFVSELCSGIKQPSDRTVRDICEEFNVNETWLRTGAGDMFNEITRDEQIADFVGEVLREQDDSFRRRFIAMLSRLGEDDWTVLERMANDLAAEHEKKD